MNRITNIFLSLCILLSLGSAVIHPVQGGALSNAQDVQETGMPDRPIPDKGIPYHEPGRPFIGAEYSTNVKVQNSYGAEEQVALTGIDAMMADGIMNDPLQSNYTMVNEHQILVAKDGGVIGLTVPYTATTAQNSITNPTFMDGSNSLPAQNTNTTEVMLPTSVDDLNGDGIDEQILLNRNKTTGEMKISIGQVPGTRKLTSSGPAAARQNDLSIDLLVRGIDQSLWHGHADPGGNWTWENNAGGYLMSAPAIAAKGDGTLYAFVIGSDNHIYTHRFNGSSWEATGWERVTDATFSTKTLNDVAEAPSATMRSDGSVDLFRRAENNTLRWCHYTGPNSCTSAWQNLGGSLTSAPAAIWVNNTLQLFARGANNQLTTMSIVNEQPGLWKPVTNLPSGVTVNTAPSATLNSALYVYVRGSDGKLWEIANTNGTWGSWNSAIGGTLSSAPAAIPNYIFAQKGDGGLQSNKGTGNNANWAGWTDLAMSACCQEIPIGTGDTNNPWVVKTGRFLGNGRAQMVMVYNQIVGGTGSQTYIQITDIHNGFRLKTIGLLNPGAFRFTNMTTGDFDRDGLDEIAIVYWSQSAWATPDLYYVTLFDVVLSGNPNMPLSLVSKGTAGRQMMPVFTSTGFDLHLMQDDPGAVKYALGAGDFDGDGYEDLAVASYLGGYGADFWHTKTYYYENYALDKLNIDLTTFAPTSFSTVDAANNWVWVNSTAQQDFKKSDVQYAYIQLLTGNLDGAPGDELVFVRADAPNGVETAKFYRYSGGWQAPKIRTRVNPGGAFGAHDQYILGDFDRDLTDEVAILSQYEGGVIWVREYNGAAPDGTDPLTGGGGFILNFANPAYPMYLVSGGFNGRNMRVGTPTVRIQNNLGDILAVLNRPPSHYDYLDGEEFYFGGDASATYINNTTTEKALSVSNKIDYKVNGSLEVGIGNPEGTHLKTSLDLSHGANFENATSQYESLAIEQKTETKGDDIVIYSSTKYKIFEYPVYYDSDDTPDNSIVIAWPIPYIANKVTHEITSTGTDCGFWYAPNHQIDNVWSYWSDVSDNPEWATTGTPADPKKNNGGIARQLASFSRVTGGATYDDTLTLDIETQADASSQFEVGMDYSVEGQVGGDEFESEASVAPFGMGASVKTSMFLPYFKASLQVGAGWTGLNTQSQSTGKSTQAIISLPAMETSKAFKVDTMLYWATNGSLVLDYATQPNTGTTFWSKYNKPDPALILPFRDFHCAPEETARLSNDIWFSTGTAGNNSLTNAIAGETVYVNAWVRNFSSKTANNVVVRFCQGDPTNGCNPIGTDQTIPSLLGRGKQKVTVPWTVKGSGEQHIYAVIDPDKKIAEMHDETSNGGVVNSAILGQKILLNNNVAYATLQVGSAGSVDPAVARTTPYVGLKFAGGASQQPANINQQSGDTGVDLVAAEAAAQPSFTGYVHLPLKSMPTEADGTSVTMRFEIENLNPGRINANGFISMPYGLVLNGFKLGDDLDKPIDGLAFGPAPAMVEINYNPLDFPSQDESTIKLYYKDPTSGEWVDAVTTCSDTSVQTYQRDPNTHWMMVPVCKTGTFALLSNKFMDYENKVYLPALRK